jgi:aspartate dehydrogenase
MADRDTLKALSITMKKHPSSLKLESPLRELIENHRDSNQLKLFEGTVRDICHLAPNNVNTMAVGALVAHNLGFDNVQACLVADSSLTDKHLIEIEVTGPYNEKLNQSFKCITIRSNPAIIGHVTGNQTYESFYNSLLDTLVDESLSGLKVC